MNNQNLKTIVIAFIAGLLVGVLGYGLFHFSSPVKLGAVSTNCSGFTTCLSDLYLNTQGGGTGSLQTVGTAIFGGLLTLNAGELYTNTNATTTSVSTTIKASDINGYDTVLLNPIVGSITVTFPASSTVATFLPTAGNRQRTCFQNATTTAGVNITFAGGTGFNLQVASSSATALGSSILAPQKIGCFDFVRGASSATTFDIEAAYTAFQ